jgi:hypothetical protein
MPKVFDGNGSVSDRPDDVKFDEKPIISLAVDDDKKVKLFVAFVNVKIPVFMLIVMLKLCPFAKNRVCNSVMRV